MKRILFTSAAAIAALGIGFSATADQHGSERGAHHAERMAEIDTDGDGIISRPEVEASHMARFAETDANGDGAVTVDEITAYREAKRAERKQRRQQRMLEKLDTNSDGTVSADEYTTHKMARYDRMDTDGDGVVSKEERKASHKGHRRGMKMHHGDSGSTPQ